MAGADGVAAHVGEHFELPLQGAVVERRAERAEIVVIADAVEFEMLAVDEEAGVGVEFERADAEWRFVGVDGFAVLRDGGDGDIAIGRLLGRDAPEFGIEDQCFG